MRQALVAALVLLATTRALAQPPATEERVILADADLELLHALESTLAPWKVAVATYEVAPASNEEADVLAKAQGARFVAWRHEGQMIVYDAVSGAAEQQESKPGPLDPPDAAAAAQLVKLLMHLPPLAPPKRHRPPPIMERPPPAPETGLDIRGQLGFAIRVARGDDSAIGPRINAVVLARPWHARPLRVGVAGELGPTATIEKPTFTGTWRDWAVLGLASWSFVDGVREVEPFVAVGLDRSLVRGAEGDMARSESSTTPLFRGGAWIRWRYDRWSMGGSLSVDVAPMAPAFAARAEDRTLYQVPRSAIAFGLVAAADL